MTRKRKPSAKKNQTSTRPAKAVPSERAVIKKVRVAGQKGSENRHQYDIAFSFAGEDREVVEVLAALLKDRGVKDILRQL